LCQIRRAGKVRPDFFDSHGRDFMPTFLRSLHAARGVACIVVVVAHVAVWEEPLGLKFLQWVQWFGYAAVDVFFVLSGFVITYTQWDKAGQRDRVREYFRARFLRVYPLLWVLLPIAVLQVQLSTGEPLVQYKDGPVSRWLSWSLLIPHVDVNPYLPSAWTLPYEVFFYILFGLLLFLGKRLLVVGLLLWGTLPLVLPHFTHPLAHVMVSPHVWEILFGCGAAGLVRAGHLGFGRCCILFAVLWSVVGVLVRNPNTTPTFLSADPWARLFIFGVSAVVLVYGLAACEVQRRWHIPRWLNFCGDASYSIYLGHVPCCSLLFSTTLRHWPHTKFPHLLWVLCMIGVGIGGGCLLHLLVERPIMNWVKQRKAKPEILHSSLPEHCGPAPAR
jgi:exopolysaccharide production protein ExoZ